MYWIDINVPNAVVYETKISRCECMSMHLNALFYNCEHENIHRPNKTSFFANTNVLWGLLKTNGRHLNAWMRSYFDSNKSYFYYMDIHMYVLNMKPWWKDKPFKAQVYNNENIYTNTVKKTTTRKFWLIFASQIPHLDRC